MPDAVAARGGAEMPDDVAARGGAGARVAFLAGGCERSVRRVAMALFQ